MAIRSKFKLVSHTRVADACEQTSRLVLAFVLAVSLGCEPEQESTSVEQAKNDSVQQAELEKRDAPTGELVPAKDSNAAKAAGEELKGLLKEFEQLQQSASGNSAAQSGGGTTAELEQCTKQLLELASNNPKSNQSYTALETVCRAHRFGEKRKAALQQLQTHHLDNPLIGKLCLAQSFNSGIDVEQLIVRVAEKSSNREVRALAIYSRSRLYDFNRRTQQQFKSGGPQVEEMRKSMPKDTWDYLMNFKYDEALTRELLQTLLDEYSDVEINGQSVKKIATDAIAYLDQTKK